MTPALALYYLGACFAAGLPLGAAIALYNSWRTG